jgi:hypothetical protein
MMKLVILGLMLVALVSCGGGGSGGNSSSQSALPPVFTSSATPLVLENSSEAIHVVTANSSAGLSLRYTLSGGADRDRFNFDTGSRALSFVVLPDFETPLDADTNNQYELVFTAVDTNNQSTQQSVVVTVTDESRLEGVMSFPNNGGDFGGGITQSLVRGYVVDREDGEVLSTDISNFRVNDQPVALSQEGSPNWQTTLPINLESATDVVLSFDDRNGNSVAQSMVVHNSFLSRVSNPSGIDIDVINNRALVVDSAANALFGVDLDSGTVNVISDKYTGQGVNFSEPNSILFDGEKVFISDRGLSSIVSVDLASGDRHLLSPSELAQGPILRVPIDLILGQNTSQMYALDVRADAILQVDQAGELNTVSGDEFLINSLGQPFRSSVSRGYGPRFVNVGGFAFDFVTNTFVVSDVGQRLLLVEGDTGHRSILSQDGIRGDGVSLYSPEKLVIGPGNQAALVLDRGRFGVPDGAAKLVSVDLVSGDRTLVFNRDETSDIELISPSDLVMHESNNLVLVTDDGLNDIVSINLATGASRRLLAEHSSTGSINSSLLDLKRNRILTLDSRNTTMRSIDLITGEKQIISALDNGLRLVEPTAMAMDEPNNRVIVIDSELNSLVQIDLETGVREAIVSNELVDTLPLTNIFSLMVDSTNNRALMLSPQNGGSVVAVDLDSGATSTASILSPSIRMEQVWTAVFDPDENKIYATDSSFSSTVIFEVDLNTSRSRIILAEELAMSFFSGLALDKERNKLLVSNVSSDALLEVDIETGHKGVIANNSIGQGPDISSPIWVHFDERNSIAYLVDSRLDAIISVNSLTGDRAIAAKL